MVRVARIATVGTTMMIGDSGSVVDKVMGDDTVDIVVESI